MRLAIIVLAYLATMQPNELRADWYQDRWGSPTADEFRANPYRDLAITSQRLQQQGYDNARDVEICAALPWGAAVARAIYCHP